MIKPGVEPPTLKKKSSKLQPGEEGKAKSKNNALERGMRSKPYRKLEAFIARYGGLLSEDM